MNGVITRVFLSKGYCFIRGDDGISRFAPAVEFLPLVAFDMAREGQAVTFVPTEGGTKGNGMRATKIHVNC